MASKKQIPASGPTEAGGAPEPLAPPVDAITKLELFLEKHWRPVVALLAVLIAAVIVYFYLKYKAEDSMTRANNAFTSAQTRSDLQAVAKEFAGSAAAGSALYTIADRQIQSDELDGAAATLQKMTSEYPDHPLHYDALLGLGGIFEKKGELDKASGYFKQVAAAGDKTSKAALAALFDIEILVAKGELEKAKEAYENYGANYAGSEFIDKAMERQMAVEARIALAAAPKAPVEPEDPKPEEKVEEKAEEEVEEKAEPAAGPAPGADAAPEEGSAETPPAEGEETAAPEEPAVEGVE